MTLPGTCRHCGQPLTPVQQHRGGNCGSAACRRRDDMELMAKRKEAVGTAVVRAAAPILAGKPASVVWLQPASTGLVAVPEARRERHRAHLDKLIAQASGDMQPLAPAKPAPPPRAQELHLCAQCGGRCCGMGYGMNAFIGAPQLLRWQQANPGRTIEDAAAWFMQSIPAEHVSNSCIYHGTRGCALPREHRADICNRFACDALERVAADLRNDAEAVFVAVTFHKGELVRGAVITSEATTQVPRRT